MSLSVVSELKYIMVLLPRLDPPMTKDMEKACKQIIKMELELLNSSLTKIVFTPEYHKISITATPNLAPMNIAEIIKRSVSRALEAQFSEVGDWGNIYYDAIMINSGVRLNDKKISEFADIVINGL